MAHLYWLGITAAIASGRVAAHPRQLLWSDDIVSTSRSKVRKPTTTAPKDNIVGSHFVQIITCAYMRRH